MAGRSSWSLPLALLLSLACERGESEHAANGQQAQAAPQSTPQSMPQPQSAVPMPPEPGADPSVAEGGAQPDEHTAAGDGEQAAAAAQPAAPIEIPKAKLLASGLPAFSRGGTLRLDMLERREAVIEGKTITSVSLPDPALEAKLDAQIAEHSRGRCELPLVLDTLVTLRCAHSEWDDMRQEAQRVHSVTHFAMTPAGEVETLELRDLLHPGLSSFDMFHLLAHDPGDGNEAMVFGDTGLEVSYETLYGPLDIYYVPWRLIAPYVRGDGLLGPALIAAGVELAPRGTSLSLPPRGAAIWNLSERSLMGLWARTPVELRKGARLTTVGGGGMVGLLFPPEVERSELKALFAEFELDGAARANRLRFDNTRVGEGYYSDLAGPLVIVEAREELGLRPKPGRKVEAEHTLAAGTLLVSVDGFVYRNDSAPGTHRWAYVLGPNDETGWVEGKKLALREDVGQLRTMGPAKAPAPEKVDFDELLD